MILQLTDNQYFMKLQITKERVLEAASKCPTAKETLKALFPEAFKSSAVEKFEKALSDLIGSNEHCDYDEIYNRIPGGMSWDKASHIVKLLGLE